MKEIPCELTGQSLAVLNAMTGRAEYLYHILMAMEEAGVENPDEILKKAIYRVGQTWGEKLGECELDMDPGLGQGEERCTLVVRKKE